MALKHLLATAAVTGALVVAGSLGAIGAQATPLPVPPGPINLPIYTQPSLPGFHLPANLWQKRGPVLKPAIPPQFIPFRVLPTSCAQVFATGAPQPGASLSADHSVRATTDPNLVALLNAQPSLNCSWTNSTTGSQVNVSVALISSSLIAPLGTYFSAQGYVGGGVGTIGVDYWTNATVTEEEAVSTNDFWVVVSANDSSAGEHQYEIVQNLFAINGATFE